MPNIGAEDLTAFAAAAYEAAGTPPEHAKTVSRHQVRANLVGHDSHGVVLLATYIDRIGRGHIVPAARPEIMNESPTTLAVNGRWGFGPVISEWTMERLVARAREMRIAAATIREQSHVGRLAEYPLMAARAGFIGLMMADSGQSPKAVAPFGGREARLGTNPICIAFPSDLPGPVFIDMATSAVAAGKLNLARAQGKPIPLGWLLDKDGKPTTNPNAQLEGGVMLPLGGPEGHKGYGLSFAVETLAAVLPGLGFGIDPKGRHNDGTFMLVIDPQAFSPTDFKNEVAAFVHYLKATPPAEGFEEVLYPGELEYRTEQRRRQAGIPIEDATWRRLGEIATKFGITAPRVMSEA
ncbi:MAG TPA: Ldh family oxidoreductase [Methylomirabilota bacterium]|nr:Ldh family oxidoreductase [Methylomirabilota bacterium]